MSNIVPYVEMSQMAEAIAASGLFNLKSPAQALALMLVAQANNQHPAAAARDYDIIQGRPSKKAEAMLRDFIQSGGSVEWHEYSNDKADATFSHPQGGKVRVDWDMKRAQEAGLAGKEMWKKWRRQMLRARCLSEGIRTIYPAATGGMYTPEEQADIPARQEQAVDVSELVEEVKPPLPPMRYDELEAAYGQVETVEAFNALYASLTPEERRATKGFKEKAKERLMEAQG